MLKRSSQAFESHIFSVGQLLVFEFHGQNLRAVITGVEVVEAEQLNRKGAKAAPPGGAAPTRSDKGILMAQSTVNFIKAGDSSIKIKASGKR